MTKEERAEFEADVRIIAAAFQMARIEEGKEPLSEEENEAAIQRLVEAKCGSSNSQTTLNCRFSGDQKNAPMCYDDTERK